MSNKFITDKNFDGIDFTNEPIQMADFENCVFSNCNFASSELNDRHFEDCTFENCDLSNAKITGTAFRNIRFKACKLIGLQFDTCHPFLIAFQFNQCILNYASFYQLKIPGTLFKQCTIIEADFSSTDLSKAIFDDCNLSGTMFENTKLQNADLYNSSSFIIDPNINVITGARFSVENLSGLLTKYDIVIER